MKDNNLHSKKVLKHFRKGLRNRSTSAEIAFWELIKNKKLEGRKFRRQHSIGNYVVDFYCPSEKLIVELDGDSHGATLKIQKDIIRDNYLSDLGFTVLRFENRYVFQEPEFILNEISKFINKNT